MFNLTTLAAPTAFPLPNCYFIQGTDSDFYAWTSSAITKVTLAGTASTVHTLNSSDGEEVTAIIQGIDGNFYGVAESGGAYSYGTLFMFTSGGNFSKLYDFANQTDGKYPTSLIQASDGNLYGTTSTTVFKSSTSVNSLSTITTGTGGGAGTPNGFPQL